MNVNFVCLRMMKCMRWNGLFLQNAILSLTGWTAVCGCVWQAMLWSAWLVPHRAPDQNWRTATFLTTQILLERVPQGSYSPSGYLRRHMPSQCELSYLFACHLLHCTECGVGIQGAVLFQSNSRLAMSWREQSRASLRELSLKMGTDALPDYSPIIYV